MSQRFSMSSRSASFGLGMLAGAAILAVAGPGCGEGSWRYPSPKSGHPLDDLVLARLDNEEIRVRDLLYKIKVQLPEMQAGKGPADAKQKRQVLQQMVNQSSWVRLAEDKGWDRDPEFLATLSLSRKFILSNLATDRAVYRNLTVPDEEVRRYFEENIDQYQAVARCQASLVLVQTEEEAREIHRLATRGADFAMLARTRSIDEGTRDSGGLVGTVAPTADIRGFAGERLLNDRILALPEGGITEPLRTSRGWAVFRAYNKVEARPREFEEVKEVIRKSLQEKRAHEIFTTTLNEIHEKHGVEVDEQAFVQFAVSQLSDQETLAMAAAEPDPAVKSAYYRWLVRQHPESPLAAQAQFLAAFTLADQLQDYAAARSEFERMLEQYPNDELAPSARWMLENMEKGDGAAPELQEIRKTLDTKRTGKGR